MPGSSRPARTGSRERGARLEYTLTGAGLDLLPVLSALSDWGERHLSPNSVPEIVYRHAGCGGRVSARMLCECGSPADPHGRLIAQVNR